MNHIPNTRIADESTVDTGTSGNYMRGTADRGEPCDHSYRARATTRARVRAGEGSVVVLFCVFRN